MAFVCQDLFQYMKWNVIVYAQHSHFISHLMYTLTWVPFHLHCILVATTMVTAFPLIIVTQGGSRS